MQYFYYFIIIPFAATILEGIFIEFSKSYRRSHYKEEKNIPNNIIKLNKNIKNGSIFIIMLVSLFSSAIIIVLVLLYNESQIGMSSLLASTLIISSLCLAIVTYNYKKICHRFVFKDDCLEIHNSIRIKKFHLIL